MKLDQIFHGDSLKASDLNGKEVTLKIRGYEVKDFDDGKKLELHFHGTDRTLICNVTNARTIGDFLGSDVDMWSGSEIVLFPTKTDFQGRQVDCIRVKEPVKAPQPQTVQADVNAPDDNEIPF